MFAEGRGAGKDVSGLVAGGWLLGLVLELGELGAWELGWLGELGSWSSNPSVSGKMFHPTRLGSRPLIGFGGRFGPTLCRL
jgi:hypothetical protein